MTAHSTEPLANSQEELMSEENNNTDPIAPRRQNRHAVCGGGREERDRASAGFPRHDGQVATIELMTHLRARC